MAGRSTGVSRCHGAGPISIGMPVTPIVFIHDRNVTRMLTLHRLQAIGHVRMCRPDYAQWHTYPLHAIGHVKMCRSDYAQWHTYPLHAIGHVKMCRSDYAQWHTYPLHAIGHVRMCRSDYAEWDAASRSKSVMSDIIGSALSIPRRLDELLSVRDGPVEEPRWCCPAGRPVAVQPANAEATMSWTPCGAVHPSASRNMSAAATARGGSPARRATTTGSA